MVTRLFTAKEAAKSKHQSVPAATIPLPRKGYAEGGGGAFDFHCALASRYGACALDHPGG